MNVMSYSAAEILAVAIEIENNASAYYTDASQKTREQELMPVFKRLSAMEKDHAVTFSRMRDGLSETERAVQPYDPGNEMLYYLEGMEGLHGWEGKAGPNARLSGDESAEEILTIALNAEQETVFFYNFLKDYVPHHEGRHTVDRVIAEEMRHVATIKHYLAKARNATAPEKTA